VEWLLKPDFYLWSQKRHPAVLWLIANMAIERTQHDRTLTMVDYLEFMKRAKWKLDKMKSRNRLVGNYLSIIQQ
jgi:hypothetical protein